MPLFLLRDGGGFEPPGPAWPAVSGSMLAALAGRGHGGMRNSRAT